MDRNISHYGKLVIKNHQNACPKHLIRYLETFATELEEVVDFRHKVVVHVVPQDGVYFAPDKVGLACFTWRPRMVALLACNTRQWLHIHLCAGLVPMLMRDHQYTRDEAYEVLCFILAHEVGHYIQWRDDGHDTERGVNVRALGMLNAVGRTVTRAPIVFRKDLADSRMRQFEKAKCCPQFYRLRAR